MLEVCPHFLRGCNGCTYWNVDYPTEIQSKKKDLESKIGFSTPIRLKYPSHVDLRTRFDFTLLSENGLQKMGLFSKNHELIDLSSCPILHPELEKAFQYLRQFILENPLKVNKGSLRVRISADLKKWGLWIDFSNVDIKSLLEEKTILAKLSQKFIIEVGQKKKRLDPVHLKLIDPIPAPWFKTFDQELLCSVSNFTQPSPETADLLTEEILQWTEKIKPFEIIEYGCGIGQYSVPLTKKNYQLSVIENDPIALEYLKLNTSQNNLSINDLQKIKTADLALVNPPRSGLKEFSEKLIDSKATHIIYISCFPQSLAEDLKVLNDFFEIKDLVLVDQFPRSSHYETAVLLKRK